MLVEVLDGVPDPRDLVRGCCHKVQFLQSVQAAGEVIPLFECASHSAEGVLGCRI